MTVQIEMDGKVVDIARNLPVYKNEAKYLSDIALKTDMFHPAAVNEKFFNESAYYFLKQIKK